MISGGDVLEWPIELKGDIEMESEHEYEEWMWEQDLGQGPPQDDDIVWLKLCGYDVGLDTALSVVHRIDFGPDNIEANEELRQQTMERLAQL